MSALADSKRLSNVAACNSVVNDCAGLSSLRPSEFSSKPSELYDFMYI